ncbi:DNRLRE domain-containing protein [Alkalihalobacillus sp. 1P02AB]|uniref:DNRLRE domain-containing protein n=1 Tax=Alkalihalobacillus sp. 1P02AB TaxID=3132260 RepID=UPI0039A69341
MKYFGNTLFMFLALLLVIQSISLNETSIAKAEESTLVVPIKADALYGATVRGGSHQNSSATIGSSTIPREILEAKWAGDSSFSRRSHLEFDVSPFSDLDWDNVTNIKLNLYLHEHSGAGKQDTIQFYKTEKSVLSEENWTWNNTSDLMENATLIGEQLFNETSEGTWVEVDITDLKDELIEEDNLDFSIAMYPKQRDDQGGIRFYSQYQGNGNYTPYLTIFQGEYVDIVPPSLSVDGVYDGQRVGSETFTFEVNATDNYDENPSIIIKVNGESQAGVNGQNSVTLLSGQNTIEIAATDASGNQSEVKVFTVILERTNTFQVIADSFTDVRSPNVNFNLSDEKGGLQLKTAQSANTTRKVYLSFDLSDNELPYIKEAGIILHVYELMGNDRTSEIVNIYEIEDFDEDTITWNNAPANGKKVAEASYERLGHDEMVSLDITRYINEKLLSEGSLERLNFVLEVENGHDQKGAHFTSKEKSSELAARVKLVEGVPEPTIEVTGIEDGAIYTTGKIEDVSVIVSSIMDESTLELTVTVNDQEIVTKGNNLYDIPLSLGQNKINIRVTDEFGNNVEKSYTVTSLEHQEAQTFYVDSQLGNDSNDGLSEGTPWKSLERLNSVHFQPGTTILFKRGGVWNGQFRPNGSGTLDNKIIVDAYGEGQSKPIINGNGISNLDTGNAIPEGAIHLYNLSFWEIQNLEVTNNGESINDASRAGIMVVSGGHGIVEHIHLNNVYVHNVNSGTNAQKISGGIIFRADTIDEKGNITGVESSFRNILVENSHVKNVAIEGLRTKTYRNGQDTGNIKNHDVVFRNNLIEDIFGDGIVISEMASGGLVEKNIVRKHSNNQVNRNYAGLWLYQTDGVIIQYNEVYDGVNGFNDGEAFDFDIGATNNIYQYNYSHNNRGGLLLTMSSSGPGNIFRYNVSKNDGNGEEIFYVMNDRTKIYNNTIYIGEGVEVEYFINDSNIANMFFQNNILLVDGKLDKFSRNSDDFDAPNMKNNLIYPESILELPGSPNHFEGLVTEDPRLVSPNAENEIMDTWTESIWNKNLSNFKLQEGSPAIDAGTIIDNPGQHDIFGTPLYIDKPDIGAHEFVKEIPGDELQLEQLIELIHLASAKDEAKYTEESYEALHQAIQKGKAVLEGDDSTQEEVDEAVRSLKEALKGLEEREPEEPTDPEVDKSELQSLLEQASAKDEAKYTEESYEALQQAIQKGKAVLEGDDSTQEEVDEAVRSLQEALKGLEEREPKEPQEPQEPQDPKDPVDPREPDVDNSESPKFNEKEIVQKPATDNKGQLPNTATNYYHLLMVGGIILTLGVVLFYYRRKRLVE